jgi:hypothetical protein
MKPSSINWPEFTCPPLPKQIQRKKTCNNNNNNKDNKDRKNKKKKEEKKITSDVLLFL